MSKCPRGVQAALCFQPWSASWKPLRVNAGSAGRVAAPGPASHLVARVPSAPGILAGTRPPALL